MQPILHINLSTGSIDQIRVSRELEVTYLGGATLAARLLFKELTPELDPLSPPAPLLFMNGPLSGTAGPAVGRTVICAKSPATYLWGESNIGGFWGTELRMAGFDGLWLTGRSDHPIYISILNEQVDIQSADHLWGMDTYETQTAIKSELPVTNPRVAVIGPAGESLIPFALILADHGRVGGRTGMGAVLGSKNVKAIAIKGTKKVSVYDSEKYSILRSKANHELREDSFSEVFHELGTAGAADYFDYLAEMPKKYFQLGEYAGAANISGSSIAESILVGTSACHACVIACGRVVDIGDGTKRKGPEYETLVGFGANLLIDDPSKITILGELCDRYGIDTISASNTIGLLIKLSDMGIVSQEELGEDHLEWGNPQIIEKLIHQTVKKDGLGQWIALGAKELAKHFGCEEEAVHVNGLEVPYHDPRGGSGMALVYATSPRGACHNQSDYFIIDLGQVLVELGMKKIERLEVEEKAHNVAIHQDWRTIFNSLVMCIFSNVPPNSLLDLVNASCGLDWKLADLMRAGERGWNLKRAINNRLGLARSNDQLPKEFHQPYRDNPPGVDKYVPDFETMLAEYYKVRGWDPNTGYPTKDKLESLGLDWIVEDLW